MIGSRTTIQVTQTWTSNASWTAPFNLVPGSVRAQVWGESGTGGQALSGGHSGGGSGAGSYGEEPVLGGIIPGSTTLTITVGAGSSSTATTIAGGSVAVTGNFGTDASGSANGTGGAASGNTIAFKGGDGGNGIAGSNKGAGGGGSSAGPGGAGNNGGNAGGGSSGAAGGTAPSGGAAGGNGGSASTSGNQGGAPGGGAGGGGDGANRPGGAAQPGQATLTWLIYAPGPGTPLVQVRPARKRAPFMQGDAGSVPYTPGAAVPAPPGMDGPVRQERAGRRGPVMRGKPGIVTATAPGAPVPPPPPAKGMVRQWRPGRRYPRLHGTAGTWTPSPAGVVNQWAVTFAQPSAFGTTPPALQSSVLALTPASSVGGGTGVPSSGNWLFAICGWNQAGLTATTVAANDDIHSFWRPGDVTTSTWAVSTSSGSTRTAVWYTPNLARSPGDVYVAPNGAQAGRAVLVIEVAGLGAWDTVTSISSGYVAASPSLNLALPAPSGQMFVVAAACGDNAASGQSLAPPSWTALQAVSASNGVDHSCDAYLTSACYTSTSSVSVNATSSTVTDISGVIIGVLSAAPSPVPVAANPDWAGRVILEAALGAGYETPPDQCTWTVLSDNAWTSFAQGYKRLWGWADSSGVPYALGQLQSGTGAVQADNADGALSPSNSASSFFPHCQPGTPIRLRMALGTLTDGTVVNRWYTWARNTLEFPEKRNKALRGYVPVGLTDVWSVVSAAGPSAYRGEIEQDGPGWWWPMDDQPLAGGVQPASLRNAAAGSATVMSINAASGGVAAADAYSTSGTDLTAAGTGVSTQPPPPSIAVYAVGQAQGWGYGDPQSSPQSYATGNPVTSNPGSAAWQQTGLQGNTGAQTWFLTANDTFPPLAAGVTVQGWFNATFNGSSTGYTDPGNNPYVVAAQPHAPITICTLSTNNAPVFELQLDTSGHLNAITFNGTTPTSHSVYSSSDLRNGAWTSVDIQLTQTAWAVSLNGGLTASASGTVTAMTSAWTWLTLNGDYGNTSGGSSPASLVHGGNLALSQWKIWAGQLPAWRLRAHYCAMITGFGLLPAPGNLSLAKTANKLQGQGYTADGTEFQGSYGISGGNQVSYALSAVAVAQAGSYTSGPSARTAIAGYGTDNGGTFYGDALFLSCTSLSPTVGFYTAAAASAETNASTICGTGDSYTSGFGSGASGHGVCHTAGGTGSSPPASPSPLGDTVAQRIERVLGYGLVTQPNRAIDSTASLLVQAALDIGGQQTGANLQNLVDSDNGLLFVDNNGTLCYRSRAHLAADTVVWYIGMNTVAGMVPFDSSVEWSSDPQRIWDAITVTPYSPDGASLAGLTPANATAANTAQQQFGARPKQVSSYLQDQTKMQAQADWYLANFGQLQRRASVVAVDAATYPAGWLMVAGMNPGDIAQIYDTGGFGQPATTGNYRVSQIARSLSGGANGTAIEARMVLVLDPLPASYWS